MNLLLDTCSLLWALQEPRKLSAKARRALRDGSNPVLVSTVSFWEISLKASIGKLELENVSPQDFPGLVRDEEWEILPLEATDAAAYATLPRLRDHKDPFDRILIHIAIRHGFHFVSEDTAANAYVAHGLRVCW